MSSGSEPPGFQVWAREERAWVRVGEPRPLEAARELVQRVGETSYRLIVRPASSIGDHCRIVGQRRG